jgi:hypothetical protein
MIVSIFTRFKMNMNFKKTHQFAINLSHENEKKTQEQSLFFIYLFQNIFLISRLLSLFRLSLVVYLFLVCFI